jgi:hypothetical protein
MEHKPTHNWGPFLQRKFAYEPICVIVHRHSPLNIAVATTGGIIIIITITIITIIIKQDTIMHGRHTS